MDCFAPHTRSKQECRQPVVRIYMHSDAENRCRVKFRALGKKT
ncbi:Protein of unknown function, partial [Gryllus bimaculatus]